MSWAAWSLDAAGVVFDARERAYRLYRERGDTLGAARRAIWPAVDHLDFHSALAVGSGWLQRAHRLLDPLEPELGRRFAVPDLEMLGLALQGATLVARTRVEEGMRCIDEATVAVDGHRTRERVSATGALDGDQRPAASPGA